jgi:hypothetical protein
MLCAERSQVTVTTDSLLLGVLLLDLRVIADLHFEVIDILLRGKDALIAAKLEHLEESVGRWEKWEAEE